MRDVLDNGGGRGVSRDFTETVNICTKESSEMIEK